MKAEKMYDVVAVDIKQKTVRIMATGKTLPNAEAFIKIAIILRGVDEEFYGEVSAGAYKDGDPWTGRK